MSQPSGGRGLLHAMGRPVRWWRSSLQLRVITTTTVIGVVSMGLLIGFLSAEIRDVLFDQRTDQVVQESGRSTRAAQASLSASTAATGEEVQTLIIDLVRSLRASGSGGREVTLLRTQPGDLAPLVTDATTDGAMRALISPELRESVRGNTVQHWQPVGIPRADGAAPEPGLIVGTAVTVPVAGDYELYYLYSFAAEAQTLGLLQRVLALGAVALVALLGAVAWLATHQAVRPVRQAARVAVQLADGRLEQRMTVRGQDEMATLARSFNAMAESLQVQIERMEHLSLLQRRFVSDVSHELRTPLTTVRMAAEMLYEARRAFEPSVARSAELLQMQLDRFEELLADLLEISRFDAGAAVLDAEERDLRDVVTSAVDQAGALADRRGVWLRVSTPETRCTADLDPRRVERILRNLLVNAIEHAEGGPVEVTVGVDAKAVAVVVRDHGVGMTVQEAERVFDRFWRADPARARATGGTGLGLAIAVEDAHLHGGTLEAWGQPGRGASFRLTLPRRAGLDVERSPLPMVPESTAGPAVADGQVDLVARRADPAALPDFDRLDVP